MITKNISFLIITIIYLNFTNLIHSKSHVNNKKYKFNNKYLKLIKKYIGPDNSVYLLDDKNNSIIDINIHKNLIPASTIKLITLLAAIKLLGKYHRFYTDFYYTKDSDLYIKGLLDPSFTTESFYRLANTLFKNNIRYINNIYIDNTIMENKYIYVNGVTFDTKYPEAYNSYNAFLSAFNYNYNSICYKIPKYLPSKSNNIQYDIESTKVAKKLISKVLLHKNLRYKFYDKKFDCFTFSYKTFLEYIGESFSYILNKNSIQYNIKLISNSKLVLNSNNIKFYHRQYSVYTLLDLVGLLFQYSNNILLNEILLKLSLLSENNINNTASIDKGLSVLRKFVNTFPIKGNIHIEEGSGISYKNKISSWNLNLFLQEFKPFKFLMKKNKTRSNNRFRVYYKTGTLSKVSSIVGFIYDDKNIKNYSFIILLNSKQPFKYNRTIVLDLIIKYLKSINN